MQTRQPKIIPHLWFDTQAKEAAHFYASVFDDSKVSSIKTLHGTPSGDCDIVSFQVRGVPFMAISAGPYFKINPSISFFVNYDPSRDKNSRASLDAAWQKLSEGGMVLMPLQEYPWSKWYGWVQDRFGVSWQLMLTDPSGEPRPSIVPSLLFVGKVYGKAEEAVKYYLSVFKDSKSGALVHYGPGHPMAKEGTVMFADFKLLDLWIAAMDGPGEHAFAFSEAVSFIVNCESQEEIDYYSDKLSAVPQAEQCGWIKDKFGVSWQITPVVLGEMMGKGTPEQLERLTKAFLVMKRFDIEKLKVAFDGK